MNKDVTGTEVPQDKCLIRQKRGKRTRSAGHNYERDCAEELRAIGFPHVVTSRAESKGRDDQKIDLMNKDEDQNGRLPYNIQCKNSCQPVSYTQLLVPKTIYKTDRSGKRKKVIIGMPKVEGIMNVIFHKFTDKSDGGKFMTKGEFAILEKSDFLAIIQELQEFRKMKEAWKLAQQTLNKDNFRHAEYPKTSSEAFQVSQK